MLSLFICFAEYKIAPEYVGAYIKLTEQLKKKYSEVNLYEGTDQPLLFVEVWSCASLEQAEQTKEERLSERSSWSPISEWIVGGRSKLHVWTFKPL